MLRVSGALALVTASTACAQQNAGDSELKASIQALASRIEEQQQQQQQLLQTMNPNGAGLAALPPSGGAPPPTGAVAPTGSPSDPLLPPGHSTRPPDSRMPPTERPQPTEPTHAFFAASPANSASVLASVGPETLANSIWSGEPLRWGFLAERALPASSMLIFRENDLLVVSSTQTLSFRVDHRPTAMQCRSLWPCVSIVDERGVAHTLHYEVIAPANPEEPAALFVLDCLTREQIEGGGEFPTDEALLENGGLLQRHRTDEILCLRRINDAGLAQVRIGAGAGGPP